MITLWKVIKHRILPIFITIGGYLLFRVATVLVTDFFNPDNPVVGLKVDCFLKWIARILTAYHLIFFFAEIIVEIVKHNKKTTTNSDISQQKTNSDRWQSKSQMKKSERAQNQLLDGYAGGKAFEEEINSQAEKLEGCMYIPSSTLANGDTRYKHEGSSETDGILITPAGIVVLEMKYMSIEDVTWAAVPKSEYWEKHETIKYFDEQSVHELKNIENGNDGEKKKLNVIRSPLFQNDKHIKVILNTLRSNGYNYDGRGHKIYNMIVLNKDLRYRAYDKEFSTKKEGFLDMTSSDVPFLVTVKGLKKKFKDWYRSQPRELADWEMKTIYNILSKADMQDHEGHIAYVKELTGSNN